MASLTESMSIGEWYNTLNNTIYAHVDPSETTICTSRDMQTILEQLSNYRPYLEGMDAPRPNLVGPFGPMKFIGTLRSGVAVREIYIVKGASSDLVISGPNSTTTVQIHDMPSW